MAALSILVVILNFPWASLLRAWHGIPIWAYLYMAWASVLGLEDTPIFIARTSSYRYSNKKTSSCRSSSLMVLSVAAVTYEFMATNPPSTTNALLATNACENCTTIPIIHQPLLP
jgi:hypothetical protein